VVVVEAGRSRLSEARSLDSRSATDGPGVLLECEELPEFEDGVIEEVVQDEDGPVFPGPGPRLRVGPGPPDELEVETGVPSAPLERERDESGT
jgi:hypothetical protein